MALRYPKARWVPLGPQTEPRMMSHDILCYHTMVGSLAGTSSMFKANGYGGTESHLGMGESKAQGIEQWQDGMYQADANKDGGHRVFSVETADYGGVFGKWDTKDPNAVPAWTNDQLDMCVDIAVWFCRKETHANCPSTWNCHKYGVPCALIPDTKPGRRGIGYHKQGCDPYRVAGGEEWSTSYGKVCPASRRIEQLKTIVIPRAQKILASLYNPEVHPMANLTAEDAVILTKAFKEALTADNVADVAVEGWDNRHDAQVACWTMAGQAWANIRVPQLINDGKSPREAIIQCKDELWPIMSPLWNV